MQTKCGYIALIGRPNAGKSTLLNQLVGQKISIVTPKAQTTRSRITGVAMHQQSQLVFVDVPGVFAAKERFEKAMVDAAYNAAYEADVIALLHDATKAPGEETRHVIEKIAATGRPCVLLLNKIDRVADKAALLAQVEWFHAKAQWQHVFMISALKHDGVDDLLDYLAAQVPTGPYLYPEDQVTDVPSRLLAAELTREQCFMRLREEIPYTVHVETETFDTRSDGSIVLGQVITVQNERQKMIVLGKGGSMLKEIGMAARREIGKALECTAHVKLFVRVRSDWKDHKETYEMLGLQG
jgi:GTP-binding protein Era